MTVFSLHENKVLKRYARPAGPGTVREGTAGSCYIRKKDKTCSVIILYGSGPFFKLESAGPQKQFHQTNPAGIKRAGEHSPALPDKRLPRRVPES